jgi:hypothetical protein
VEKANENQASHSHNPLFPTLVDELNDIPIRDVDASDEFSA